MKTAEEWSNEMEMWEDDGMPHSSIVQLVKQIQIDAYKAGMTESAEICFECETARACEQEILHARDNKTEI